MKLFKKIACFMCAAALAAVPALAWAASASVESTSSSTAEVYALNVNGQNSVHVNLEIKDQDGNNVPGATFDFSSQAISNKVANSHYINGIMTIIVSNAQNTLNGTDLSKYDLGTLHIESQVPVNIEVKDVSASDASAVAEKIDNSDGTISAVVLGGNGSGNNGDDDNNGDNNGGNTGDNTGGNTGGNTGNNGGTNNGGNTGINGGNGSTDGNGGGSNSNLPGTSINGGGSNSQTGSATASGSNVGNDPTLSHTGDNMGVIVGACLLVAAVAAAALGILMFRRNKARRNNR